MLKLHQWLCWKIFLCFTINCVTGNFTFVPAPKAGMSLICPELTNCLSTHIITCRQFQLCSSSLESPTVWQSRWIVLQTQKITFWNGSSSIAVAHFLLCSRALLEQGCTGSCAVRRRMKTYRMCLAHCTLMLKVSLEGEYTHLIARLNRLQFWVMIYKYHYWLK